jgi:DNA polymerase
MSLDAYTVVLRARVVVEAMLRVRPSRAAIDNLLEVVLDLCVAFPSRWGRNLHRLSLRTTGTENGVTEATRDASSLAELRRAAADCRACELWRNATQTVFGEGPSRSHVMLVGEQPGDREDIEGHPFVGPAGRVLDDALDGAGIDRDDVYLTNAVKHFKWKARGKRRIHDKPNAGEVAACRPWLESELSVIEPRVLVPLGATAAQALLGRSFRVTKQRGEPLEGTGLAPFVVATVHPSAILRAPDSAARSAAFEALTADLAVVARLLAD